jgi:hypothetical protein
MTSDLLVFKPRQVVVTIEDDSEYKDFLSKGVRGLRFIPTSREPDDAPSLAADTGDFAKWAREHNALLQIAGLTGAPKLVLKSDDLWLALVFIASDVSLPLFLNMVANYLYDKARGSLRSDPPRVHMSAVYHDAQAGKTKKFEFSGDEESLAKAIKKFDLNEFFDEIP